MEDKPLIECADHAVIRLEYRLRDRVRERPVAGIVTPESVEPAFAPLSVAVRGLLAEYRHRTGYDEIENRFDPEPSAGWKALTAEQRAARVQTALDSLAAQRGLRPGTWSARASIAAPGRRSNSGPSFPRGRRPS